MKLTLVLLSGALLTTLHAVTGKLNFSQAVDFFHNYDLVNLSN